MSSNSLTFSFFKSGTFIKKGVVTRPDDGGETTTEFTGLPLGTLDVTIKAYPTTNGSGIAQASGNDSINTTSNAPAPIELDLQSSVVSLTLTPTDPALKASGTLMLTAKGKDSGGHLVLLAANGGSESVAWTTDDPDVATVTGDGAVVTLNGVGKGSTKVRASMQTGAAAGTVTTSATVTVSGADGTVIIK